MKLLVILTAALLVGCASHTPAPIDVQAMPNDCANRQAMINWLTREANVPKQTFESQEAYEQSRARIRAKMWTVRYHCQPV